MRYMSRLVVVVFISKLIIVIVVVMTFVDYCRIGLLLLRWLLPYLQELGIMLGFIFQFTELDVV